MKNPLTPEQEERRAFLEVIQHPGRFRVLQELYNPARENALTTAEIQAMIPDVGAQNIFTRILHPLRDAHIIQITHSRARETPRAQYFVSNELSPWQQRLLEVIFAPIEEEPLP